MSGHELHDAPANCENCATPLQGGYCHACGQSVASPIRHAGHALEEMFEAFWHLDGRIFRTLHDIVVPGRVAINYLAGQRARYVAPLRLFVVLSVLTFFVAQMVIRVDISPTVEVDASSKDDKARPGKEIAELKQARTIAEVERYRARTLEKMEEARAQVKLIPIANQGFDRSIAQINRQADRRIEELRAEQGLSETEVAAARAAALDKPPSIENAGTLAEVERLRDAQVKSQQQALTALAATAAPARDKQLRAIRRTNEAAGCRAAQLQLDHAVASEGGLKRKVNEDLVAYGDPDCQRQLFIDGDEPWDEEANPIVVKWAPAFLNRWINTQIGHGKENVARAQKNPSLWVRALLAAVPSALFLMVPVFALLLKLAYLGSGRLYLEHLVVALYSHVYLCLSILVFFLLIALSGAITPHWAAFGWMANVVEVLLWLWLPVYLLLMQKRVYGNGWWLTLLRYFVVGNLYFVLLSFAALFVAAASLVRM